MRVLVKFKVQLIINLVVLYVSGMARRLVLGAPCRVRTLHNWEWFKSGQVRLDNVYVYAKTSFIANKFTTISQVALNFPSGGKRVVFKGNKIKKLFGGFFNEQIQCQNQHHVSRSQSLFSIFHFCNFFSSQLSPIVSHLSQ